MRARGWTRRLLMLGLGGLLIAGCAAILLLSQEAVAEIQQTGTPFSNPTTSTTQADQATKITPEQEAALVEVWKILREAWEVANSIVPRTKLFRSDAPENNVTESERYKNRLLRDTELTRFWAGDFATATTSHEYWDLAIAQIRYGHLQEAVQTATNATFPTDQTLVILKLLSDAGDLAGALKVAEAQTRPGKNFGEAKRRQEKAELLAYVARRQSWVKNPEALATLRQAMYAVRTNKDNPEFQYGGTAALGCAQAAMGDQAGATESFRQGIHAAAAIRKEDYEGQRVAALSLVGRAAAQSGLQAISREAFQESLRLASQITEYKARVDAIANLAVIQFLSGDRIGGMESFQEASKFAESLSSGQQRRAAMESVMERQLTAGEREAAEAILEQMGRRAEVLTDPKEQESERATVRHWEAKLVTPQLALDRAYAIQSDDERQAGALAYAAYWVVHSKKPVSTPEILQRMSQTASALLAKPLPADQQKADQYLSSIARVQAVADGASQALQTVGRIKDSNHQNKRYVGLISLLTQKRDVAGAKQVAALLREEWLPWDGTGRAFAELGKAIGASEDISAALTWARQQKNLYVRVEAMLGTALGIMEQQGIYELERDIPTVKWLVGKGPIDKLAISCGAL